LLAAKDGCIILTVQRPVIINNMKPVLQVKNLSMNFGGLKAIDNLEMDIKEEEIVAIIGPNGAGKTTLFNCITGIYEPTEGDIYIAPPKKSKSIRLNRLKPNEATGHGLARTFQNIRLFQNMTVLENVMIGRHCRSSAGILSAIFRPPSQQKEERNIAEKSYRILQKIGLISYVNEFAKNLPYGAQRRLEIARAMATEPFLLLLDEPAAGMNIRETAELDELIKKIRDEEKISIVLIEHDMKLVMSISDRVIVLDYGEKIGEGTPEQIRNNPAVIEAYLGEETYA
jgi:branched-chain amino acid transport system ATP-binding protein